MEVRKAESDLGPIKYVAELIYGSSERDIVDKAVRLVIILIMLVFDPLAVLLLIAGNMTLAQVEKNKKKTPLEEAHERIKEKIFGLKVDKEIEETIRVEKDYL